MAKTYDIYYVGLRYKQRLTNERFGNAAEPLEMVPDIIKHTEEEIGEAVDDPKCYVVLSN